VALGAGQFVGQTVSSAINKKSQWELYDDNTVDWWIREELFEIDPSIRSKCSHHFSFEEVTRMENLVLITCNSIKDLEIIRKRNRYLHFMDKDFLDVRLKYHQELHNHLIDKKKDFFQLIYSDLWDIRSFLGTMKECMSFLQLPFDEEKIRYGYKKWMRSNILHINLKYET
jgi:hypothetical protein